MATIDRIRTLVQPILDDLGLELYDLEFAGGTLRITVDRDGGVDLGEIELATRTISREFDHLDPIEGHYTLEVSSPGLERTLRTPEHYRRVVGREINVKTHAGVEGDRRVQGLLVAADGEEITVRTVGKDGPGERRLRIDQIERARTVFVWGGAPKPGKAPGRAGKGPGATKAPVTAPPGGTPKKIAPPGGTPKKMTKTAKTKTAANKERKAAS